MRNEIMSFRVTADEKKLITNNALSSYRLVSDYLRDCALDKKITVIPGLEETEMQLRRIGTNLNQLTHLANSGEFYSANLKELREEVVEIWQSLNSCLQKVR